MEAIPFFFILTRCSFNNLFFSLFLSRFFLVFAGLRGFAALEEYLPALLRLDTSLIFVVFYDCDS